MRAVKIKIDDQFFYFQMDLITFSPIISMSINPRLSSTSQQGKKP